MLYRYTIYRRRPANAPPPPKGIRQDTRWRTKHILRPTQAIVEAYLANPTDAAFALFRDSYLQLLEDRYRQDLKAFERLAAQAASDVVFLGCSCPTKVNPDVRRCHTYLALGFMKQKFPALAVQMPGDCE